MPAGCTLLHPAVVDAIHRCVHDPGRVANSEQYYRNVTEAIGANGVGEYIEMVAVTACLTQVGAGAVLG